VILPPLASGFKVWLAHIIFVGKDLGKEPSLKKCEDSTPEYLARLDQKSVIIKDVLTQ
jgi:hypothetical protein